MSESGAAIVPRAIVAGHGDFAAGLVSAVEQITGRGTMLVPVAVQKLCLADIEELLRQRMLERGVIVLNRIDDRLIHGQVVVGWGQPLDIDFIVLVDDQVASSEWERELYRMGVPPGMDVYFHSAGDAGPALARYRTDPRRGILLTGDVATMRRLVDSA